ncbi:unnamed protein product [Rotaria sp. Silwood1]|nr:unnamed protein product [Rotaria sp. Silwood1]
MFHISDLIHYMKTDSRRNYSFPRIVNNEYLTVSVISFCNLHNDWIVQVKWIDDLDFFISCALTSTRSLYIGDLNKKMEKNAVTKKGFAVFDYCFIHLKRNSSFSFLLINIEIDDHRYITTSLFISPNHLIFLANDKEVNNAIFASQLHSGDHIKYVYKNEIILGKIRNIYLTIEEGYCAPFTPSGTIIIDNVLVSNYASVNNHYLAHNVIKIYRWWIYLFGSNKNNENIHWILKLIERLVQWCGIEKFSQISMFNGVFQIFDFI